MLGVLSALKLAIAGAAAFLAGASAEMAMAAERGAIVLAQHELGPPDSNTAPNSDSSGSSGDTNSGSSNDANSGSADSSAPADTFGSISLKDMQQLLMDDGYRAAVRSDSDGKYLESAVGGRNFYVTLSDCADANTYDKCENLRFESSIYKASAVDLEKMNKWNRDVGGGWSTPIAAEGGGYYMLFSVSITGGVTADWMKTTIYIFGDRLARFDKFVNQ